MAGKSEDNVKTKQTPKAPPSMLAWVTAATVGQSFSGGIGQAAKLLRPSLRAVPKDAYNLITQAIIFVNIASWVAVYLNGVDDTLSTKQPTLKDKLTNTIDDMDEMIRVAFPGQDINSIKLALRSELQDYLTREKKAAQERQSLVEKAAKNPSVIKRLLSYIPGSQAYKKLLQADRLAAIHELFTLNANENIDEEKLAEAKTRLEGTQLANICNRHVERLLPSKPLGSLSELFSRASYSLLATCINGYAFIANNIGFMVMGGLGMLSMLNITNPVISSLTLAWFFCVGSLSALSFSKPGAISGYHQIFGYSKKESKYLKSLRAKSQRAGLFKLPLWLQAPLAISLATSIAILNFAANVALGQVIFAGKSLFSPVLFSQALFNPMAAAYPSLLLGAIGGTTALVTLSLMLTGAVMQIKAKDHEAKVVDTNKQTSKLTVLSAGLAIFAVACKIILPASIVTTLSSAIFMSSVMFTLNYNEKNTISANVAAAVNIGISTFLTYYFNVPLLKLALPARAAQGIAAVFALANAELTPPVLNRGVIDEWQHKASKHLGLNTKVKAA